MMTVALDTSWEKLQPPPKEKKFIIAFPQNSVPYRLLFKAVHTIAFGWHLASIHWKPVLRGTDVWIEIVFTFQEKESHFALLMPCKWTWSGWRMRYYRIYDRMPLKFIFWFGWVCLIAVRVSTKNTP